MTAVLRRLLFALLLLCLPVVLAGALGRKAPLLDLANLVMLPAALGTALAGLALAWLARRWWKKTGYALAGLAGLAMAWPPAAAPTLCAREAPRLRIAWLNTEGSTDPAPIIAWLEQEQPDLVGMAELHRGTDAVREAVRRLYPVSQSCLARDACATTLFSRVAPLASAGLARGDPANRRALSAASMTLPLAAGDRLDVIAAHLSRPLPLGRQGEELAELETHLRRPADTIIVGDLNATARMRVLQDFAGRNLFGIGRADGPTWPLRRHGTDLPPVIQIDHLLVGRNWAVERLRTSADLGSDHRGLVGDICRNS